MLWVGPQIGAGTRLGREGGGCAGIRAGKLLELQSERTLFTRYFGRRLEYGRLQRWR